MLRSTLVMSSPIEAISRGLKLLENLDPTQEKQVILALKHSGVKLTLPGENKSVVIRVYDTTFPSEISKIEKTSPSEQHDAIKFLLEKVQKHEAVFKIKDGDKQQVLFFDEAQKKKYQEKAKGIKDTVILDQTTQKIIEEKAKQVAEVLLLKAEAHIEMAQGEAEDEMIESSEPEEAQAAPSNVATQTVLETKKEEAIASVKTASAEEVAQEGRDEATKEAKEKEKHITDDQKLKDAEQAKAKKAQIDRDEKTKQETRLKEPKDDTRTETITTPTDTVQPGTITPASPPQEGMSKGDEK